MASALRMPLSATVLWLMFLIQDVGCCSPQAMYLHDKSKVDCNFETGTFCRWKNGLNGAEDDFDWQLGSKIITERQTVSGSGYFAYAQGRYRSGDSDNAVTWLVSPIIRDLSVPASLTFSYWKTSVYPVLQVCARNSGESRLRCFDTIIGTFGNQWSRRSVLIPPSRQPFQIIFVASKFSSPAHTVAIDDIELAIELYEGPQLPYGASPAPYSASGTPYVAPVAPYGVGAPGVSGYYPSVNPSSYQTGQASFGQYNRPYLDSLKEDSVEAEAASMFAATETDFQTLGFCPAVDCNFTRDFCQWRNDDTSRSQWKMRLQESLEHYEFYLPPGDRYIFLRAHAHLLNPHASLVSEYFIPLHGAFLQFQIAMNHPSDGRITVYSEQEPNTRETVWQMNGNAKLGGPNWQKVRIPLPFSTKAMKLVISADLLKINQYIALDDFQIVNGEGQAMGCVVEPSVRLWKEWKLTDELGQKFSHSNLRDDPNNAKVASVAASAVNWTSLDTMYPGNTAELYSFLRKFRQDTTNRMNKQERMALGRDIMQMVAHQQLNGRNLPTADHENFLKFFTPSHAGAWKAPIDSKEAKSSNGTDNSDPWGVNQLLYEIAKDLLNLSGIIPQETQYTDNIQETSESWLQKIFG